MIGSIRREYMVDGLGSWSVKVEEDGAVWKRVERKVV